MLNIIVMQNSQRQIYEEQIELLRSQIEEQSKREQKLRDLIDTLSEQMQYQRQTQQQNMRLTQINRNLIEGLRETKYRHGEEVKYYDSEISKLKSQIQEKINQNQRSRVEHEKRQLVYQEKIAMLQQIIEKKCHRMNNLQKKIHDESIIKLKQSNPTNLGLSRNEKTEKFERLSQRNSSELGASTLRISHIENCYDTENNMRASNISGISRKSKPADYLYMDKSQMKVMMGALIKSKREMEKGNIRNSDHQEFKPNKTML